MFKLVRKLLSLAVVLIVVALVLNLNIKNQPARVYAQSFWQNPYVQTAYHAVKDRIMAVINKDINVEDVFKPDLNKTAEKTPEPTKVESTKDTTSDAVDQKVVKKSGPMQEAIKPADKQKLKKIIKESSKK